MVCRYDRQLSNRVLKLYLRTFGDTDYVSVLFDSDSCSILWEGFMVTVDCTMQHITQRIYVWREITSVDGFKFKEGFRLLYKSVANISQNIDNIPSYLKDDIMALLQQVSRYMLRPLSVLNGKTVNVSACKYNLLQQYLEFFRQYPAIARVYLTGSALTEECCDKSDLDFLLVIKDGVDMDTFIRDTPFEEVGYDDYIFVTSNEWEQYCASPKQSSAFYWNVLNKGVLIYESH